MIKVAAVDDERHALERLESLLTSFHDFELCASLSNGKELLSYLKVNSVDVLFLDIEMPGPTGLELAAQLQILTPAIDIVFLTAFNQYAMEAFEMSAIDYILKPLTEKSLKKVIERLRIRRIKHNPVSKPIIQCFGKFEVYIQHGAVTWINPKVKETLAFLIHNEGIPVSWEIIAGAVWPEMNFEKAYTNFHVTMYLLLKRLWELGISEILENADGIYRIRTEKVFCDYYESKKNPFKAPARYMEKSGYSWTKEW